MSKEGRKFQKSWIRSTILALIVISGCKRDSMIYFNIVNQKSLKTPYVSIKINELIIFSDSIRFDPIRPSFKYFTKYQIQGDSVQATVSFNYALFKSIYLKKNEILFINANDSFGIAKGTYPDMKFQ